MRWLRVIAVELLGLVVDDVGFAASVVGWIVLSWAASALVLPPSAWVAAAFVGGLVILLLRSVLGRAGRSRRV